MKARMSEQAVDTIRTLLVHPAWEIFRAGVKAQEEKHYRLATDALRLGWAPDPCDVKYWQGFFDAAKHLTDQPEDAQKFYDKQLAKEAEETPE